MSFECVNVKSAQIFDRQKGTEVFLFISLCHKLFKHTCRWLVHRSGELQLALGADPRRPHIMFG